MTDSGKFKRNLANEHARIFIFARREGGAVK